jgi:hypothetical protein
MHFVAYLYIMDLTTTCISVKQTRLRVSSASVNVFVMRLWVCNRIQVQLNVSVNLHVIYLNKCQLFSSVCRLRVNCEVSDCCLVDCHIVCFFMWCSLVNCHIVCLFMWRCASASAARSRHKQYERSEMKVRMSIYIFHCWRIQPSGM